MFNFLVVNILKRFWCGVYVFVKFYFFFFLFIFFISQYCFSLKLMLFCGWFDLISYKIVFNFINEKKKSFENRVGVVCGTYRFQLTSEFVFYVWKINSIAFLCARIIYLNGDFNRLFVFFS